MQRVLLIGNRESSSDLEDEFPELREGSENPDASCRNAIYQCTTERAGWYSVVKRCDSPQQLIEIVEEIAGVAPIDVLDILDHGVAGGIAMGSQPLFSFRGGKLAAGEAMARRLACSLSETAQVRLLGCATAHESEIRSGRSLLLALAQALGGNRVVFGTIAAVTPDHFSPEKGFTQVQELLFSSLAALDIPAPAEGVRGDSIDKNIRLLQTVEGPNPCELPARSRPISVAALDRAS